MGPLFLCNVCKRVLEGGAVSAHVAATRTVFIPKSSDVDDNGLMVRSPDASRPLTLCNCDGKIIKRRYALACTGTPSDAYTWLRDASRPGK